MKLAKENQLNQRLKFVEELEKQTDFQILKTNMLAEIQPVIRKVFGGLKKSSSLGQIDMLSSDAVPLMRSNGSCSKK